MDQQTEHPNDLLKKWLRQKRPEDRAGQIEKAPEGAAIPLSYRQERIWVLQQLHPANPFYNYVDLYRFEGPLNQEALLESIDLITRRHDVFRVGVKFSENKVIQEVLEDFSYEINREDLRELTTGEKLKAGEARMIDYARKPFDLAAGNLFRLCIIQLGNNDYLVGYVFHHLIMDKWSMQIFQRELKSYYRALAAGNEIQPDPPAVQYTDYAYWNRANPVNESALRYWEDKLKGHSVLQLPASFERPLLSTYGGAFHMQEYGPNVLQRLESICDDQKVTLYTLLLAVFKVLLLRLTNEEDILIGTPVSDRTHTALEELIGFFDDTLVLRSDLSGSPDFLTVVKRVSQGVNEALEHKNIPFDELVKRLVPMRSPNANPLFNVMFIYHEARPSLDFGDGVKVTQQRSLDIGVTKFDFTLYVEKKGDQLFSIMEYAEDLFDRATVEKWHQCFQTLVHSIIENPTAGIYDLNILNQNDRSYIFENWSSNPVTIEGKPVHNLIEEWAQKSPDAIAVEDQLNKMTYAELDRRSGQLALLLHQNGIKKGDAVGLLMEPSLDAVVGLLGILKSGGVYVPMDTTLPQNRISYIIEDAGIRWVISDQKAIEISTPVIGVDEASEISPASINRIEVAGSDRAYMIYTSGSTGKPKGVVVTHANLSNSTLARFHQYPENPGKFLLMSSLGFDSSIAGLFWTLCSGGSLVIVDRRIEQDPEYLGRLVSQKEITHSLMLPSLYLSLLNSIDPSRLSSLIAVIVAGEACPSELAVQHFKQLGNTRLYNEYGPTEGTVWATVYEVTEKDIQRPVPIGRPIPNANVYVLDSKMEPVPVGVVGELFIGGDGVAEGYVNNAVMTSEKFLKDPFQPGNRSMYRSGDLVSYRPDGNLQFHGRVDEQVKLRGYRIELPEIRQKILEYEGIDDAYVTLRDVSSENLNVAELSQLVTTLKQEEVEDILDYIESIPEGQLGDLLSEKRE